MTARARGGRLDFLSGHRIMRHQLIELWPDNESNFTGWTKFRTAADFAAGGYFASKAQFKIPSADSR